MCVFNSAVPRLDTTSIETMVAFQFDGTPLLFLSIQVNIGHVWAVAATFWDFHYSCTHYISYLNCDPIHNAPL